MSENENVKIALIVVDVQNDFCEGGSLPVEGGKEVAKRITDLLSSDHRYDLIVFTADWHDGDNNNSGHFSDNPNYINTWPVHCVAGTEGALIAEPLRLWGLENLTGDQQFLNFFLKGQGKPSYSGFEGKNFIGQSLDDFLKENDIVAVDIVGLAGDYCVKATGLDAVALGYDVIIPQKYTASVGGPLATHDAVMQVYRTMVSD
jgi:nicotinamidase/pyrazinamidase